MQANNCHTFLCSFSCANLSHQKSKQEMFLDCNTLLGTIECNSAYADLCDEICHKSTTSSLSPNSMLDDYFVA